LLVLVAVFATLQISQGFQLSPPGTNNALSRRNECNTKLSVASQDTTETTETTTEKIPYSISRGDGSTGGGGRAMPNKKNQNAAVEQSAVEEGNEEDELNEELKRPKVGAEMPHGRPSWFRVPAPSQGTSVGASHVTTLCAAPYHTYSMRLRLNSMICTLLTQSCPFRLCSC
jgi:hypothetical protein